MVEWGMRFLLGTGGLENNSQLAESTPSPLGVDWGQAGGRDGKEGGRDGGRKRQTYLSTSPAPINSRPLPKPQGSSESSRRQTSPTIPGES